MEFSSFRCEKTVLEVRYEQGYRYLDVCGTILNRLATEFTDIEIPGANPQGTNLIIRSKAVTIDFGADCLRVVQEFPQSLSKFEKLAARIFELTVLAIEVRSLKRVGNRVFLVHENSDFDASRKILESAGLFTAPKEKWGLFGDSLARPIHTRFRVEEAEKGAMVTVRADQRTATVTLPLAFSQEGTVNSVQTTGIFVDVDFYTKVPVPVDGLDLEAVLRANRHTIENNLGQLFAPLKRGGKPSA